MQNTRNEYQQILDQYKAEGKSGVRLTQSSLFFLKAINPTTTSYRFDVLDTETTTLLPEEIRLNINDEFTITQLGCFLVGNVCYPGGLGAPEVQRLNRLWTYSPQELGTPFCNTTMFYMGQLSISVNNIKYVEKWDVKKHNYVPFTQFQSWNGTDGDRKATQNECDYSRRAMQNMLPKVVLSGSKKNDINIQLPAAISAAAGNWVAADGLNVPITQTHVGLFLRGWNAQNGARFQR